MSMTLIEEDEPIVGKGMTLIEEPAPPKSPAPVTPPALPIPPAAQQTNLPVAGPGGQMIPAVVNQVKLPKVQQPAAPPPPRGFAGNIKESWRRGAEQVNLDREAWEAMMGLRPWEEVQKKRQALQALQGADEIGKESGFLGKSVYGAAAMFPPMLQGIKQGIGLGVTSAAGAAIAGQLGPQIAVPEEVVTVPGAFAAGNTIGQFEYWARQGTGQIYGDLRDAGVSHETAKRISPLGGLPYAAIEFSQVDKIIPGLGRKAKDFAKQTLMKGLLKLIGKATVNVGLESIEEAEQQVVTDTATAVGKYVDGKLEDVPAETRQAAKNAWQAFYQSLGPMALLQVPGTVVGGARQENAPPAKTATDYRARIESLGIPADQMGDYPDRMAAAKTPEELEAVATEFANTFKDVLPKPELPPIVGAQIDFLAGEIEKVRATAGETAAKHFEDKYLSQVKSGQPLTEEQQSAANQEMLQAIEDSKAGKSFQVPLTAPAISEAGTPPVEPVAPAVPPAVAPISPPPAPAITEKVETPLPAPAGVAGTQRIPEAPAGAPVTSPAAPTTEPTTSADAGPKAITPPGAGPGTISLGTDTRIHGTRGQEYEAKYAVVPRSELVTSHEGVSFTKNPDFPLENARDYTNPAEQAKVQVVRAEFSPDRHVTDSTDASVGPVMVAGVTNEQGKRQLVVLGGNNREMAIQTMSPEKRQALADFTNKRAERFGVQGNLDAEHELVRFMGEYDLRTPGTREKLQSIIDSLNPSPGKVQSQSEMAAVDAGNIPIEKLAGVEMDMDPKKAAVKVANLIAEGHLDRNLRSQISEHPEQAQEYLRRLMVNMAFRDRTVADFVSSTDAKGAAARGLVEAATPGVLALRAKGQNELADAFSRSMATIADYVRKGQGLETALFNMAKQMETDPAMAIIQDVAETMRRNVAVSAKTGKIIAEDSITNFNDVWTRISNGLKSWDTQPDMFGEKTTADQVIRNVLKKVREEQTFENGEIRISKGEPKSAGPFNLIKARQGQYLVDEMMKVWQNKPIGGVMVIQSDADLDALGMNSESRQAIRNSKAEGFYHIPSETVIIIADNLRRPSDAIRVMLHESIGHYGIRKVLGADFEAELDRLGKLIPTEDLQAATEKYGEALAVEEYLANEASVRNPTLWQQFIKAIRAALQRIGVNPNILDKWDTRGEIEKLIDTARDFMENAPREPTTAEAELHHGDLVELPQGQGTVIGKTPEGNAWVLIHDTNEIVDSKEPLTGEVPPGLEGDIDAIRQSSAKGMDVRKSPGYGGAMGGPYAEGQAPAAARPGETAFKLEALTRDQLRSEMTLRKQNAEARRKAEELQARAQARIEGGRVAAQGDLFGQGETPLLERRRDVRMSKPNLGYEESLRQIKREPLKKLDKINGVLYLVTDPDGLRLGYEVIYGGKDEDNIWYSTGLKESQLQAETAVRREPTGTHGYEVGLYAIPYRRRFKSDGEVGAEVKSTFIGGPAVVVEDRRVFDVLSQARDKMLSGDQRSGALPEDAIPHILGNTFEASDQPDVNKKYLDIVDQFDPKVGDFVLSTMVSEPNVLSDRVNYSHPYFRSTIIGSESKLSMAKRTPAEYPGSKSPPLLIRGEVKDVLLSKPAEGEPETRQHKFGLRVAEDERMNDGIRAAFKDPRYTVQHDPEVIDAAKTRISGSVTDAYADFANNKSDMKAAERIVVGQMLMQAHNEAARASTAAQDEATAQAHLNRAIDIGHKLDEYGLEYGRGVHAFANWNDTLSTLEGAQRMFERTREQSIDEILNKSGAAIESVKQIAQEENVKAIDETMMEEYAQRRIGEVLARMGMRARNGMPERMKKKAYMQGVQDFLNRPENSEVEATDIRFAGKEMTLDEKIDKAARYGVRVLAANKDVSFDAFARGMKAKYGPNIEKYLQRIFDQSAIMLDQAGNRGGAAKGADTRAARSMNSEINAILKGWFAGNPNAPREPVLDLLKAAGMTEREAVGLVMGVQQKFIEKAQKAKERRLQQMISGRVVPLTNPKAIRRLLELSNLAPLDDAMVRDTIAKAYGLPELTPEIAARLDELAKAIKKAPEGFQQDDATRAMLNYMRKQMPPDKYDIGWAMWYANILSGYQTAERNFLGNTWNALDNLAASAVAEPRNAPFAVWGFIRGVNVGVQSAINVLKTGNFPVRFGKFEMSSALELSPFQGAFRIFNAWKYVLRSLQAADMLFFKPAQESRAMMIAANMARREGTSGADLWRRTAEIMGKTWVQQKAFRQQAIEEGLTGLAVKQRTQEIAEQQRPHELAIEPMTYAQQVTFNYQPEGQIGILANGIAKIARNVPLLRLAVPFTRIVANVANTTIDHTPWGFVRAWRGMRDTEGRLNPIVGHRRAQLMAKATMGTAAMVTLYALDKMQDDDDDKKKFAIYAAGPGDMAKRHQMEETGWRPYSIRIGKHYFDYRLTPFAVPFAIVGHVRDAERWKKMDESTIWSRMAYATLKSGATIFEMSFLSGVNQLVDMLQRETPDSAAKALKSYIGRNAGSLIPALFKQVDRTFDTQIRDNATINEALLREVPIASHLVKPKLNLLGEPVLQTTGPTSIFFSKERSNPVWQMIVDNEAWISTPAKDTKIGYGIRQRVMTEDEYYEYVQESGRIIRERLEQRLPDLQKMSKERVGRIIDDITEVARERVKSDIWRKNR